MGASSLHPTFTIHFCLINLNKIIPNIFIHCECIAQQKTKTSLATGVSFPKKMTPPGGLSSLFTRGDGAEVPLVGLRNDACGTSRRPVDGGEDHPPQETHW